MSAVVVVPTYNEIANVEPLLRRLDAARPGLSVLFVDDGSPDGTAARVRALAAERPGVHLLLRPGKGGLASA
jgi:dolichol-phosphate mannosyltransferase